MKPAHDETADLLETLIFTVNVVATSSAEDKQRVANAYQDARSLVATIGLDDEGSARPRIVACLERFGAYKAAGDVAAAGWMLAAMQARAAEHDLVGWQAFMRIIDDTVRVLSPAGKTALH